MSLVGSVLVMPLLLLFAQRNQLYDIPNKRSSHVLLVPRIGGIVFFTVFTVYVTYANNDFDSWLLYFMLFGATFLFVVGLYDDLRSVKPVLKLVSQMLALLGMVYFYHDAIERFRLHTIFEFISADLFNVLVFCFFLVLINAVNLMDGIDGLAALVSINFFSVMAIIFFRSNHHHFSILSLVIIGSLMAFLFFNFSRKFKIFMGDCGSLFMGFLMCCFALQLIASSCCDPAMEQLSGNQLTYVFAALFSLPIFDIFRVIFLRMANGKPIFQADRNHLHHFISDKMGKSHVFTAVLLCAVHLSLIILALLAM
jgi:UDP-N-acetylmuramyl pentapeptide phosphotransferase/UDP-N-acetylglucosamine-1-phosphate transferase